MWLRPVSPRLPSEAPQNRRSRRVWHRRPVLTLGAQRPDARGSVRLCIASWFPARGVREPWLPLTLRDYSIVVLGATDVSEMPLPLSSPAPA